MSALGGKQTLAGKMPIGANEGQPVTTDALAFGCENVDI